MASGADTPADRVLVWMSGVPRGGIRGTDWQMAGAMSRHAHVLWVDPPMSPATSAAQRHATGRPFRPSLAVVDNRMDYLTPTVLPGFTRPGVRATTSILMRSQVRWALRRLGRQPAAVVSTGLDDLLGYWGRDVVDVLYGTDDYVAGAELMGMSARRLSRQERRVLARADVVAAVSPYLAQRWSGLGASPVVIPNGCLPSIPAAEASPAALPDLPPPVVGLIGQLSDRIDLSVLESVASAGLSLLIVGPLDRRWAQPRFADLIGRPNVHYAGPVPADAVPAYLAAIDVGITPYRDSAFNRSSFPLKTLEYLGAGRPVVSADLPAARWLREDLEQQEQAADADQMLVLVPKVEDYVGAIRRVVSTSMPAWKRAAAPDQTVADRCRAFAAGHTWARRAEALAFAIGLNEPTGGPTTA
jgi:teichuronic acid biosynthesis glycosyltransferase TuaH